jgi:hypothetical protein
VPSRQAVEPLDGRMQQLGIGRKGDGLRLHRGVDRDPLEVLAINAPASCAPAGSEPAATACRRAACANGSGRALVWAHKAPPESPASPQGGAFAMHA